MSDRGIAAGARMYRHSRGEFEEGEVPSTRTAADRARVRRAAANGKLPARKALEEYVRERNEGTKAELDRATKGLGDA